MPLLNGLGHSEFIEALKTTIPPTPEYLGSSETAIQNAIDSGFKQGASYIIFNSVSEKMVDSKVFDRRSVRITYNKETHQLIAKLVQPPHESASRSFEWDISIQTIRMGLDSELHHVGSGRAEDSEVSKEPDSSWLPRTTPPGRNAEWPSVVVESGWSESLKQLRKDALLWIKHWDVRAAIVIAIRKHARHILIEKWVPVPVASRTRAQTRSGSAPGPPLEAQCARSIVIKEHSRYGLVVTFTPLVIRFEEMFLRKPTKPEEVDYVIDHQRLEMLAEKIWDLQERRESNEGVLYDLNNADDEVIDELEDLESDDESD